MVRVHNYYSVLSIEILTKTVRGPSQKLLYQIKEESHRSQD
nr:MAG TPA: hypothetical protein [Caudoviricetes sp.]